MALLSFTLTNSFFVWDEILGPLWSLFFFLNELLNELSEEEKDFLNNVKSACELKKIISPFNIDYYNIT